MTDGLDINPSLVEATLTQFIREELTKAGFHRAVLGLSGGLDSSATAALGARALGPENVTGVLMPYGELDPTAREDALGIAEHLGIQTEEVNIRSLVDAYASNQDVTDRVRKGNLMTRARMLVLYDRSAHHGALVLGTSNKTEFLLGYFTLWGDMCAAITPLGDLYKTQVRALALHLGLPHQIVQKPPTAGLWEGQSDEDELGFTYDQVDRLLYHYVDRRMTPQELLEAGFTRLFIEEITSKIRSTQYKRRPPIIAKLSWRTAGKDFRYPRDWGL